MIAIDARPSPANPRSVDPILIAWRVPVQPVDIVARRAECVEARTPGRHTNFHTQPPAAVCRFLSAESMRNARPAPVSGVTAEVGSGDAGAGGRYRSGSNIVLISRSLVHWQCASDPVAPALPVPGAQPSTAL